MSAQFGKLCSVILLEHFGEIIQKVANDLYQWGTKPLRLIVASTRLPLFKVKQALRVLIQYGFVTFEPNIRTSGAEYTLVPKNIVLLLRYPRYLLLIKTQYGDEAERLVEELLRTGQDNASRIITRTAAKLKEHSQCEEDVNLTTLCDTFSLLVTKQFIMRCPSPVEDAEVPVLIVKERELYLPPDLNKKALGELQEGQQANVGDENMYWRVNFDKVHQEFRDQIMIAAITRRIDENAGELMRHLLAQMYLRTEPWAATSNPIPHIELKDAIRKRDSHPQLFQYLDQYLKILDEDSSNFVNKVGDSGGGQYSLNIKETFTQLAWTAIENTVLERFGSKSARIFRLVKAKKFVDQEQIQQIAMIPAKEAKLLTYQLLQENFLQMQELRKSLPSNAPNKTFFLFHINLNQISRMVLEICYQCLYNTMVRREHEKNENRRLIEKQQRIASITQHMREQGASAEQLAEIEEMLTPPELNLVEKVRTMLNRLSLAELQMDETMFILQLYLAY